MFKTSRKNCPSLRHWCANVRFPLYYFSIGDQRLIFLQSLLFTYPSLMIIFSSYFYCSDIINYLAILSEHSTSVISLLYRESSCSSNPTNNTIMCIHSSRNKKKALHIWALLSAGSFFVKYSDISYLKRYPILTESVLKQEIIGNSSF